MLSIIICMFSGIAAGFFLRKWKMPWLDRGMIVIIWLLLFFLGLEVGADDKILKALPSLGLRAFLIALTALIGSSIAALALYKWAVRGKKISKIAPSGAMDKQEKAPSPLRGSLVILSFFIAGCIIGYLRWISDLEIIKDISFYTLAVLIVLVGLSIGHNKEALSSLKGLNPKYLLLPLGTILGTLAACSLLSFALPYYTAETLAIGSGQAYYSLSSILITQAKGAELGTVALLANIMRELITLLSAPLLFKVFGPLSPIAAGGATTADTTLPIIRQVCGPDLAILSVYHGFTVDFSVPFLVSLFLMI